MQQLAWRSLLVLEPAFVKSLDRLPRILLLSMGHIKRYTIAEAKAVMSQRILII